jgi:hypothetical protein
MSGFQPLLAFPSVKAVTSAFRQQIIIPRPIDPGEFSFFKTRLRESLSLFFATSGLVADLACGVRKFL